MIKFYATFRITLRGIIFVVTLWRLVIAHHIVSSAPVDLHLSGLFCNFMYNGTIRPILHVEIGRHNIDVGGCVLGCACDVNEVLVKPRYKRLMILFIRWWLYHELTDLVLFILGAILFILTGLIGLINN